MYDCLPDDVFTEKILLRLPIKSILQCSCVCKSWRSLITSPDFISTHIRANIKTKIDNKGIFLQQLEEKIGRFLFVFDNQNKFRPVSLNLSDHASLGNYFVGSANGLICISIAQRFMIYFILFNPLIERSMSIGLHIPPSQPNRSIHTSTFQGLGFDETTQDYKILYIVPVYCLIYSLNSNSWRRINPPPILKASWFYLSHSVVFVNGAIHWFVYKHVGCKSALRFIMAFDIKGETFSQIPMPEGLSYFQPPAEVVNFRMAEFGESSIAVIQRSVEVVDHIWVMKEYGKVESWIKLATIDSVADSRVLGFKNKDEVFIRSWNWSGGRRNGCIVPQNIIDQKKGKILKMDLGEDHGFSFSRVYKYTPSLVLLNKAKNVDTNEIARRGQVEEPGMRRSKRPRKQNEELGLRRSKRSRKPLARYGEVYL